MSLAVTGTLTQFTHGKKKQTITANAAIKEPYFFTDPGWVCVIRKRCFNR